MMAKRKRPVKAKKPANNSLIRAMADLIRFIESHKATLIGTECTSEEYERAVKPAVLARDEAKNAIHSAATLTTVTYKIENPEAKGEIRIEQGRYGVDIYVNGKCLADVDLFYFSPEWNERGADCKEPDETDERSKERSGFPQINLYTGADIGDHAGYVRWVDGEVVVVSDHPTARTETVDGPSGAIQVIRVKAEDTSADGAIN